MPSAGHSPGSAPRLRRLVEIVVQREGVDLRHPIWLIGLPHTEAVDDGLEQAVGAASGHAKAARAKQRMVAPREIGMLDTATAIASTAFHTVMRSRSMR